jgi:hypothetical protein
VGQIRATGVDQTRAEAFAVAAKPTASSSQLRSFIEQSDPGRTPEVRPVHFAFMSLNSN